VAVDALNELAAIPQCPEIHHDMNQAEMQEKSATQSPPLAILSGRAKIGTPSQLYSIV
jgi:hypothetical protein